ncbi:alpha/beta fold hydrolase [Polaribacter uvawellassae]|uniref:alpha/beta fold hydrolase n=1 Tax=Polaribacter uvawellassae TaxID=3133495 RepID=UPI00321B60EE
MQNSILYKNTKISFLSIGKGSTIVLLHGFLENSSMWNSITKELSKQNRVICIDLLGHGKTDCIGYIHSMELMAEAVEAVLKHLRIRKPIIIGHSMGGYVALAFAEKNPNNLKGLCLMNSTSLADDDERKILRARANKLVQNNFKNMVQMSFTNLFSEQSRITFKDDMRVALKEALQTPVQGYIACQEGMRIRPNREHVLQRLSCQKLLIIGKKDPVLDYEISLKEAKNNHLETVVFDDGHMSHIENKIELVDVLQQFVKNSKRN